MNYNKVILGGRLTGNPELLNMPSGDVVCNFRVAVNRAWKDPKSNEKKEDVCFIDVAAFGKRATFVSEWFEKGSNILLEGRLRHRVWEDKQGDTRSKHSIVAEMVTFADGKGPLASSEKAETRDEPAESTVEAHREMLEAMAGAFDSRPLTPTVSPAPAPTPEPPAAPASTPPVPVTVITAGVTEEPSSPVAKRRRALAAAGAVAGGEKDVPF